MVELLLIRLFIRKLRTEIPERTRTESIDGPFSDRGVSAQKSLNENCCFQNSDMGFDFFDLVGSALRTERRNTVQGFDPELFRQWKILIFHNYAC